MAAKTVYQIFRYGKVKSAGAIRWREIEQNRTQSDKDREFNGDIDFERTQNNVYLVQSRNFLKTIEEKLKEHGIEKHRKDAILMLDGVVTLSPEKAKEMTKEELEQYFKDALAFVEKYQGVVINAIIHYDETTPHMHYDVVPLVKKADDTWKLSAKDVVGNSSKMSKMQTLFNDEVGKKYGLERGERRTPNKENRKHKSKLQHDIEMQQATIAEQKNIIKEHNDNIKDCEMLEQAYTANIQNQETTMQDNDVAIQNQNKAIEDKKAEYDKINEEAKEAYYLKESLQKEVEPLQSIIDRRKKMEKQYDKKIKPSKMHTGWWLVHDDVVVEYMNVQSQAGQTLADQKALEKHAKELEAKEKEIAHYQNAERSYAELNQQLYAKIKSFDKELKEEVKKAKEQSYEQAIADVSKALDKPISEIQSAIQVEQEANYTN